MRICLIEGDHRFQEYGNLTGLNIPKGSMAHLPEGFERDLVETLESRMDFPAIGSLELFAGISTTTVRKDDMWQTAYDVREERRAGDLVLYGYGISFWLLNHSLKRLWPVCNPHLKGLYKQYERSPTELNAAIWHEIKGGLARQKARINRLVTEKTIEIEDLCADRRVYQVFED